MMKTHKLTLDVSDLLLQQLKQLSELTEESIETLAIRMIASQVYPKIQQAKELDAFLADVTLETRHDEIETGEIVGCEIF